MNYSFIQIGDLKCEETTKRCPFKCFEAKSQEGRQVTHPTPLDSALGVTEGWHCRGPKEGLLASPSQGQKVGERVRIAYGVSGGGDGPHGRA